MKMRQLLILGLCGLVGYSALAATTAKKKSRQPVVAPQKAQKPLSLPATYSGSQKQLTEALALVRNGQFDHAAVRLYSLSRRSDLADERMQIKYILGVSLMEMKLSQVAAFQFVDVIRNGNSKYTKQAIEKLSIVADELGDETLLNYAISKVQLDEFPEKYKDMIFYRLGEIKLKNGQYEEAAQSFAKVGPSSRYYAQAKFNRGRAFLEAKKPQDAVKAFGALLNSRANAPVTDTNKVAAELAIARSYYQAQNWDEAIEWYRKIPRDTEFWHDALFEQSWAYLRAAKFRSALSNFHSHHSAYYEDFYIPESLLLRSIVYLYICKYDEMEKVLNLFERTYGPIRTTLAEIMRSGIDPMALYQELDKVQQTRKDGKKPTGLRLPYNIAKSILDEGDVRREMAYLKALAEEKQKLESIPVIGRSSLGVYAHKVLANRVKNTKVSIGEMARSHINWIRADLKDLFEQASFVRYEMINGQKEQIKKRIAGKDLDTKPIDEKKDREFYVQNGYEYWPFDGEYWLDEVGNYHYLGKQSCE